MSADWISRTVADLERVNNLVIPGTHDAASWIRATEENWFVSTFTWAQRLNFTEQLHAGVRVLDLRIGLQKGKINYSDDQILMYHGPREVNNQNLDAVLAEVRIFLDTHPGEFVILMFQQQGWENVDCSAGVKRLITKNFGINRFFSFDSARTTWPTAGDLKGRVMVMERLKARVSGFCDITAWPENPKGTAINVNGTLKAFVQDNFKNVSKNWGRDAETSDKITVFRKGFHLAALQSNPSQILQIHHTSYSNKRYEPWTTGEIINTKLQAGNRIVGLQKGIVMIDDADVAMCNYLLSYN
jgi:hypothetical protein